MHARSPEPGALPLLLSHGWPGSIVEFLDVIGPLTDPAAHGGDPADAFHVVAPSLPGYGFSGPTHERGWNPRRMAGAFAEIMAELGYDRYGAQGGDWGSLVSANVADVDREHVCGLHLNFVVVPFPKDVDFSALTPDEQAGVGAHERVPDDGHRLPGDPGHEAADRSGTGSTTRPPVWPRGSSRSSGRGPTATATSSARSPRTSCSRT